MSDGAEPLRVLIVEDDANDAELIRRTLERDGFRVEARCVSTEGEVVDALKAPWDVVLSDFEMPPFDGLRAFELVRAANAEVPFIFVSGALGEERAVRAMRAGARDYLLKSQLHRLNVTVRRELRAAAERRDRLRADAATTRHQRRLAMAVEASGVGVLEQVGTDVYLSERSAEILGVEPGAFDARAFPDWLVELIHPDDVVPFRAGLAARTPFLQGEYRLRRPDGTWLFVAVTLKQFQADHWVGVMQDLSARHRLESELRHAQKMDAVGRVAGSVAHDFNNLLTAILCFGELLARDEHLSEAGSSDVAEIIKATQRASELTQQLLAFSRRRGIAPRVVELNSAISDTSRLLQRLLDPRIRFDVVFCPKPWNVRIDPGAFEQVLVNLVVNARDAMPQGGELLLQTENVTLVEVTVEALASNLPSGSYVQLAVTDTGVGMDAETCRRVFEPFFTTKEPGKGTGLGLSTCYGIVRQAGGAIVVKSEKERGARFEVYLPRVTDPLDTVVETKTPSHRTADAAEVILLVEDDPQVGRLIVKVLSGLGYQVLFVGDAAAALAKERETPGPIHLLLTDVMLPTQDGVELAVAFAQRRPRVPVAFITGFSHYPTLQRDAPVLFKPFSTEALVDHVRSTLAAGARPMVGHERPSTD